MLFECCEGAITTPTGLELEAYLLLAGDLSTGIPL